MYSFAPQRFDMDRLQNPRRGRKEEGKLPRRGDAQHYGLSVVVFFDSA